MVVRARRLDDPLENSVLKLLTRKAPTKWGHTLGELQSAIPRYAQRLRNRTAAILLGPAEVSPDRRKLPATGGVRHFLRSAPKLNGKAPGTASVTIASWLSLPPEVHDLRDR